MRWVLDFAAAGASEIATEERFEHQHKRVAFSPLNFLFQDVGSYSPHL
jgi:hypothetical protein